MNDSHLGDSLFGEDPASGASPAGPSDGEGGRHQHPDQTPPARRGGAKKRPRREARGEEAAERVVYEDDEEDVGEIKRGLIPILIALALVVGGGAAAFKTLGLGMPDFSFGSEAQDYEGTGTGEVDVRVRSGDTGFDIGSRLVDAGVVKSAQTFAATFGADPDAAKLQPGTYSMKKQMSSASALELMLSPASRKAAGVTIPEGLWASEIYQRLSKATGEPVSAYSKVKAADLGLPASADGEVEGFLFPSTYEFDEGATATEQLKRMVDEFKKQTAPLKIPADELHRTLTVASIVQAESPGGDTDPKVARVVENRLQPGGETAGRLQMDSTVHFVLKKRGTITTSDKDRESDSPYNTYKAQGLPPGPINSPGLAALKAAANPAEGDWLYFVTVDLETGETRFASDKSSHDANVRLFQGWCSDNPGKC